MNISYKTFGDGFKFRFDVPLDQTSVQAVLVNGIYTPFTVDGPYVVLDEAPAHGVPLEIQYSVADPAGAGGGGAPAELEPLVSVNWDLDNQPPEDLILRHPYFPDPYPVKAIRITVPAKRLHVRVYGTIPLNTETGDHIEVLVVVPAGVEELLVDNGAWSGPEENSFGYFLRVIQDHRLTPGETTLYSTFEAPPGGISRFQMIDSLGMLSLTSAPSNLGNTVKSLRQSVDYINSRLDNPSYYGADFISVFQQSSFTDVNFNAYVSGAAQADTHPYYELPLVNSMKDVVVDVSAFWSPTTSLVLGVPSDFMGNLILSASSAPKGVVLVPAGYVNQPAYTANPLTDMNSGAVQVPQGGQVELIMRRQANYYGNYMIRQWVLQSVSKATPVWTTARNFIARGLAAGALIGEVAHPGTWVLNTYRANFITPDRLTVGTLPPAGVPGGLPGVTIEIKVTGPNAGYTGWETKFEARFKADAYGGVDPMTIIKEVAAADKLGVGLRRFYGGLLELKVYSYTGATVNFTVDLFTQSAENNMFEAG